MGWARTPRRGSTPGARRRRWPAPPRRSRQGSRRALGSASPRGTVRKASGCPTGAYCELSDLDAAEYNEVLVWMRNVLGVSDHLKGFGQAAGIEGWIVPGVGAGRERAEALGHDPLG